MLTEEIIFEKNPNNIEISSITKLYIGSKDLTDISIISKMKNLEMISLPSNKISYLNPLSNCKNLREINLRNNSIFSFDELYYLANLKKLKILCLEGNPISYDDNYAEKILKILPQLQYLDNKNVTKYKNIINRNKKSKYMKRVLTEEKNVKIDFEENKNISNLSNYKTNNHNNNKKKIILKRVFSYFDSSNNETNKENSNNISNNKHNYIQHLKFVNKDKGNSERKKEINFKNIKLKFKNQKRNIYKNILLNNYLKKYPQFPNNKQTINININNTNINKPIINNNNTVQNTLFHHDFSEKQKSTTINSKFLSKGKNILQKKIKGNIRNLKFCKFIESNNNCDNNYVMAASLLVNKISIQDLILLKRYINKKIESLNK